MAENDEVDHGIDEAAIHKGTDPKIYQEIAALSLQVSIGADADLSKLLKDVPRPQIESEKK